MSRFVETFEIMRLLLEKDGVTYKGRHYSIDAPISLNPKPINRPLPMWIAGGAEPAIKRAARLGDGWNIAPGFTPDMVRLSVGLEDLDDICWDLDQALAGVGR